MIYYRSLDFDETTEPKQLRSTGSLKEVTYAELEIQFNPPDITSDMYDNTMDDLDYMTFCARTTLGVEYPNEDIPGQIVEKEKDTINENENQEMDDPDFDPMGEDLYAVLDEHEFKFNRSTKVSQKEADLLMQVRGRSQTAFTR